DRSEVLSDEGALNSHEFSYDKLSFWQRLAPGLGQKWQYEESDQEYSTHGHAGVAQWLSRFAKQIIEADLDERPEGGDEAADVVTEAGPRRSQVSRKKLWEIHCVATEQRKLAEAHDGNQDKYLPQMLQRIKHVNRRDERGQEGNGKCWFAANSLRNRAEAE